MSKNKNLSGGLFAAKPMPLTIKETSLSGMIAEFLTLKGVYNDRLQCGTVEIVRRIGNGAEKRRWIHLCKTGTPDRFALICGQIVFIEVKKIDGKPTNAQIERHDELRIAGAIVLIVNSFDDFIEQFTAIRAFIEEKRKGVNLYE